MPSKKTALKALEDLVEAVLEDMPVNDSTTRMDEALGEARDVLARPEEADT